jgi:hypothetical protein
MLCMSPLESIFYKSILLLVAILRADSVNIQMLVPLQECETQM